MKKKFTPTELGINVTTYLEDNFPDIMNYKFTADMETKLDLIAENKLDWLQMLNDFYNPFNKKLLAIKPSKTQKNKDNDKLLGKIDENILFK